MFPAILLFKIGQLLFFSWFKDQTTNSSLLLWLKHYGQVFIIHLFCCLFCSDQRESQAKYSKASQPKDEEEGLDEEDEEEHGDTLCGACGENYASDEFWICCDVCEKWFHGKCVKITPARAEHIKQYKCPSCNNKRARP